MNPYYTASISGPAVVREDVGGVEVCVNVTNADDIPPEGAVIVVQATQLTVDNLATCT